MKSLKSTLVLWMPVIVVICALVCCAIIYFVQTNDYEQRLITDAVITDIQIVKRGQKYNWTTRIYYSFIAGSDIYYGQDSFKGDTDRLVGDIVEIFYRPDNPQKSSMIRHPNLLDLAVPFFVAFPLVFAAWGFSRTYNKSKLSAYSD